MFVTELEKACAEAILNDALRTFREPLNRSEMTFDVEQSIIRVMEILGMEEGDTTIEEVYVRFGCTDCNHCEEPVEISPRGNWMHSVVSYDHAICGAACGDAQCSLKKTCDRYKTSTGSSGP